jgi:hypothetical protein
MLYRKVIAMHGSVSADRYLPDRTKNCPQSALIVNSRDERHLNPDQNGRQTRRKRVTPMKSQSAQAEEKINKKNELLYAFVRPTSKQWYRSGNMFPKCPPPREKIRNNHGIQTCGSR